MPETEPVNLHEFDAFVFVSYGRLAAKLARISFVNLVRGRETLDRVRAANMNGELAVKMIEQAAAVATAANPPDSQVPGDNPVSAAVRELVDVDEIYRGIGLLRDCQDDLTAITAYDAICRGLKVDDL